MAQLTLAMTALGLSALSVQDVFGEVLEKKTPPAQPITHSVFTAPTSRSAEFEFEAVRASDILLTGGGFTYTQSTAASEWKSLFSYGTIDFDYEPVSFDFLGQTVNVSTRRYAGQTSIRHRVHEHLTLFAAGGIYDGFNDYRSAWLDRYYAQQFSTLPGYQKASPGGFNLSGGIRWEYLPGTGFLQFSAAYLQDQIAPGYEIDFTGLFRARDRLHTKSFSISSENILSRRIRVLNEFRATDTTGRETRYGYQGSLNFALAEHWVLRVNGGYTRERPTLEAFYGGGTLEYEVIPSLYLSVSGRYYQDTGEIENSLLFSNAAPGLQSQQIGAGVRYVWNNFSVKLFAAPYTTRYEATGLGTAFFANLYKNRDWIVAQAAATYKF